MGALGPIPSALAAAGDTITSVINAAVTAEALAVTYPTGPVENASATGVSKFVEVLKEANASEYEHYKRSARSGLSRSPRSSGPRTRSSTIASRSR